MVKGCQRKVIFVKNTGSEIFDEAFFVVSTEYNESKKSEEDMVREVDRIISEQIISTEKEIKFSSKLTRFIKKNALPFLVGAAVSLILCIPFLIK